MQAFFLLLLIALKILASNLDTAQETAILPKLYMNCGIHYAYTRLIITCRYSHLLALHALLVIQAICTLTQ